MGALEKQDSISPETYLHGENDRVDGTRYEYVNGYIYAMAGASRNHNRIAGNFFLSLGLHLRNSHCQVFQSDMKVGIRTADQDHFYYPDVQVTCDDEDNDYYNTSPCLIIEVLSDSTARTDRNEKRLAYRLLPSLHEYVLCSQDSPVIEIYRKRTQWQIERYTVGQTVTLESVEMTLLVDELYDFMLTDDQNQTD